MVVRACVRQRGETIHPNDPQEGQVKHTPVQHLPYLKAKEAEMLRWLLYLGWVHGKRVGGAVSWQSALSPLYPLALMDKKLRTAANLAGRCRCRRASVPPLPRLYKSKVQSHQQRQVAQSTCCQAAERAISAVPSPLCPPVQRRSQPDGGGDGEAASQPGGSLGGWSPGSPSRASRVGAPSSPSARPSPSAPPPASPWGATRARRAA